MVIRKESKASVCRTLTEEKPRKAKRGVRAKREGERSPCSLLPASGKGSPESSPDPTRCQPDKIDLILNLMSISHLPKSAREIGSASLPPSLSSPLLARMRRKTGRLTLGSPALPPLGLPMLIVPPFMLAAQLPRPTLTGFGSA
jgi:hypothetical protein